jgi:hypothetical protein
MQPGITIQQGRVLMLRQPAEHPKVVVINETMGEARFFRSRE